MSLLDTTTSGSTQVSQGGEEPAIAELRRAFADQRRAFMADRSPSMEERRGRIEKIMGMVAGNRRRIGTALREDFGSHPAGAADLIEVAGPLARAQNALDNLEAWMAPSPRQLDPALMGTARAYVQPQPKGVVGNIVPWNFPFDLACGTLVDMLAAGNRVIVKPSEFAPASAALLRAMVRETFDPTLVHVAVGETALARAFSGLPWDHLLYTGSTHVGRQVMAAAAANLTPVTLELGGKCPAVFSPGSVTARNVEQVMGIKTIKNGQMCISVDHCFIPRPDLERFAELARAFMDRAAPGYARTEECTGIISTRHLDRLAGMLEEARGRQARVIPLEDDASVDPLTRRMPLSLVLDPPADLRIMQEEIFGPILPVLPYDDLEDAVAAINAGDRPLGLYVFGDDQDQIDGVLTRTISGGAAVNTCAIQGGLPQLAFGGVGTSGMGRHHGEEGFREFSNPRGVVVRGDGDHMDAFYPPYAKGVAMTDQALGST